MTLTNQQQAIVDDIRESLVCNEARTIVVRGYAGTGKTFTLSRAAESVTAWRSIIVAPTQAALSVLKTKINATNDNHFCTVAALTRVPQTHVSLMGLDFSIVDEQSLTRFCSVVTKLCNDFRDESQQENVISVKPYQAKEFHRIDVYHVSDSLNLIFNNKPVAISDVAIDTDLINRYLKKRPRSKDMLASTEVSYDLIAVPSDVNSVTDIELETNYTDFHTACGRFSSYRNGLMIVDEFSMVSEEDERAVRAISQRLHMTLVLSGDPQQLQPVQAKRSHVLDRPKVHELNDILRSTDKIAQFAQAIRQGKDLRQLSDITKVVLEKDTLKLYEVYRDLFIQSDITLTLRNKDVNLLNSLIREDRGFAGKFMQKGEKLICNAAYNVKSDAGSRDFTLSFHNNEFITIDEHIDPEDNEFYHTLKSQALSASSNYNRHAKQLVDWLNNGTISLYKTDTGKVFMTWANLVPVKGLTAKEIEKFLKSRQVPQLINANFAYASTVHKAQGSEWDNVLYLTSSQDIKIQGGTANAPYTAITRAREVLIVLYR